MSRGLGDVYKRQMKFYEPKESNMTIEYNHKKDGVETDSGILAKVKDPQGNSVE